MKTVSGTSYVRKIMGHLSLYIPIIVTKNLSHAVELMRGTVLYKGIYILRGRQNTETIHGARDTEEAKAAR